MYCIIFWIWPSITAQGSWWSEKGALRFYRCSLKVSILDDQWVFFLDCQPAFLRCITLGRRPKSIPAACKILFSIWFMQISSSNARSITRAPGYIFPSHLCGLLHNCVLYTNCLNASAISHTALDATHPHSRSWAVLIKAYQGICLLIASVS